VVLKNNFHVCSHSVEIEYWRASGVTHDEDFSFLCGLATLSENKIPLNPPFSNGETTLIFAFWAMDAETSLL
jgi:hypothetical protein